MTQTDITAAQVADILDENELAYSRTPEGCGFRLDDDSLLVYWDTDVPEDEQGWAYRVGDPYDCDSGPIDDMDDLYEVLGHLLKEAE